MAAPRQSRAVFSITPHTGAPRNQLFLPRQGFGIHGLPTKRLEWPKGSTAVPLCQTIQKQSNKFKQQEQLGAKSTKRLLLDVYGVGSASMFQCLTSLGTSEMAGDGNDLQLRLGDSLNSKGQRGSHVLLSLDLSSFCLSVSGSWLLSFCACFLFCGFCSLFSRYLCLLFFLRFVLLILFVEIRRKFPSLQVRASKAMKRRTCRAQASRKQKNLPDPPLWFSFHLVHSAFCYLRIDQSNHLHLLFGMGCLAWSESSANASTKGTAEIPLKHRELRRSQCVTRPSVTQKQKPKAS